MEDEQINPEATVTASPINRDIAMHPVFMQSLYTKKLLATDNLTPSEGLDKERETWRQNKALAELAMGGAKI